MSALSPILRQAEGGRLMFRCPGCDMAHQVRVVDNGPGPLWTWNRDPERPTIEPSILVTYPWGEAREERRCHSFVRAGFIEFLGDCTHALAGRTVPIPAWEREEAV